MACSGSRATDGESGKERQPRSSFPYFYSIPDGENVCTVGLVWSALVFLPFGSGSPPMIAS